MDAFDDLHRETPGCGVVHQAHKDLRCGGLTDWLERWGAFTACHIWQADLWFTTLETFTAHLQSPSLTYKHHNWLSHSLVGNALICETFIVISNTIQWRNPLGLLHLLSGFVDHNAQPCIDIWSSVHFSIFQIDFNWFLIIKVQWNF